MQRPRPRPRWRCRSDERVENRSWLRVLREQAVDDGSCSQLLEAADREVDLSFDAERLGVGKLDARADAAAEPVLGLLIVRACGIGGFLEARNGLVGDLR